MKAELIELGSEDFVTWDDAIEHSINGTIFHRRQFLAYHGGRFSGRERFVGFRLRGEIIARMAFAIVERKEGLILLSPYGASYGGIVFSRLPSFQEALAITDAFLGFCDDMEIDEAHLANPIKACLRAPLDIVEFALLHRGFQLTIRDMTSVFVRGKSQLSERGRRSTKKASQLGVTIDWNPDFADFWHVVELTYAKHGVSATHSAEEFCRIRDLVGERVSICVAYFEARPVAGLGCFQLTDNVDSAFYICSDPAMSKTQALSFLIKEKLDSLESGVDYFSFGTSSYEMIPRMNIFEYKENFTKIGMFRDTYSWKRPR
jgi:hypothetical protein